MRKHLHRIRTTTRFSLAGAAAAAIVLAAMSALPGPVFALTIATIPTGAPPPCACDDANPCTADTCGAQGQCIHTTVACDDGNPCTGDSCNPASGCIATPLTGDSCDDGNACTLDDVCNNGACVAGGTVDCATANLCYPSTCDPATGWCLPAPKVSCDDHNACTNDYCDPEVGCMFAPIICRDGNPRTVDACNPASGCVFIPKTARPGASKGHAAGPQEVGASN